MRQVAVTGATGFIGRRLCDQLVDSGYTVKALVRNPHRAATLPSSGVTLVQGGLHDRPALKRLVQDSDIVIHAAGAVRGNSLEPFQKTNRDGTAALIDAISQSAPNTHLILLSSLAAREPQLSWYAHSKREAEKRVEASALRWTILRPPAVYGPGDREMQAIFDSMSRGIALVPGSLNARTALIHVDDLVRAILATACSEQVTGECFELGDGATGGYQWSDLASIAGTVYRRRVRVVKLPAWLLDMAASLSLQWHRLRGTNAMLTPQKVRELRHDNWTVDETLFMQRTGWSPEIELERGLSDLQ